MKNAIERLARLGYAAKGTVYVVIGFLAAAAGKAGDRKDAFAFILRQPFGRLILLIIALGLTGYALWRLISGIRDSEDHGRDAKGLAVRFGSVVRGLAYGWIAIELCRLALRQTRGGAGGDAETRHWTARALNEPMGQWLVIVVGLYILGYGLYQLYRGWKGKLGKNVPIPPGVLKKISRFGIAARGVVFLIIGSSLFFAATKRDPREAHGTSGALHELASQPPLLAGVGIGLVAYGIYAFLNARYRQIRT